MKKQKLGSIIIYYDEKCSLCADWIQFLQKYGYIQDVNYQELGSAPTDIKELSQKENAWIISRDGKKFVGYSGFVECAKQSKIFFWYGYIGNTKPLKTLGNAIYRIISSRRACAINKNKEL